jgi:oxygen-dependent protoporphyrinogen oxidase
MERTSGGLIRGYLRSKREDAAAAARRASGARYEQFMAPRDGMSAWIDGLARHLPANSVSLNCRVVGLALERQAGDSSWMVTTDRGSRQPFDGVILATPASVTAKLLQSVAPDAAAMVSEIPYASSAVVAMIVNRADIGARMDGFGVVVPSNQGRAALAISYSSNKYPGRTPEGEVLLRVFLGGALRPDVVDWSDTDLQRTAVNDVRDILAWKGSQPNWQAVIKWKNAMPQYLVGHVAKIQRLREQLDGLPSLQLCGAAYEGVGIPQCVRSARQAAERLLHCLDLG